MNDRETRVQRDQRIKDEERRLVRLEDGVEAIRELMSAVREDTGSLRTDIHRHFEDDDTRFASIDSRLQGVQSQLTTISRGLDELQRHHENTGTLAAELKRLGEAIYTDKGINRVEVLWQDRHDEELRSRIYKQWWAWLTGGIAIGVGLVTQLESLVRWLT